MTPDETDAGGGVLIVVPTLNEAQNVGRVIGQLLADAPERSVLVVADGGSTDATRDAVRVIAERDPRVRLVENPARVQSAGVNRAAAEFGGSAGVLVRADAHADYPADYVATLVEEQRRTGAAAVSAPVLSRATSGFAAGVAAAQNSFLGTGGSAHRVGAPARWVDHGHNALFQLKAFRSVGGYDESFRHNEDAELDHRLGRAGHRIWLTDRTRMIYHPRRTPEALWRQYFNYGYGRASMLLKHRLRPRARQAAPLAVPPAAALALAGLAFAAESRQAAPLLLALPLAAWAALCLAMGVLLAARARRADVLWAGPAAMISHFAWATGFFYRLLGRGGPAARRDMAPEVRHGA